MILHVDDIAGTDAAGGRGAIWAAGGALCRENYDVDSWPAAMNDEP